MNALGWRPILLLEYPKKEGKIVLPEGLISSVGEKKCLDNIKEIYSIIVEGNFTFTPHYNVSKQPQF
jgi:hypothetical protein